MTFLHREVQRLTDSLVDSILSALRGAPLGGLVALEPPRPILFKRITSYEKERLILQGGRASLRYSRGKFIMTHPDGRVWKATRKRDLIRRAKQQGFDVVDVGVRPFRPDLISPV